jgi:fatty-acyl-CoA synthase
MGEESYQPAECYSYPLIIKKLLLTSLNGQSDQEIVYRDLLRLSHAQLVERIHHLADGLSKLCVSKGDAVAVMDWDSHRYLECYFAIPMMGAVLQTVNCRLSPEQIVYTVKHAEAKALLVNSDFLPIWKAIHTQLPKVKKTVVLEETPAAACDQAGMEMDYETMLAQADPLCGYHHPDRIAYPPGGGGGCRSAGQYPAPRWRIHR